MERQLTLREIQLRELEILKKVVPWLEANHIRYSLACGTLLGAIRHDGFIPWDDDMDICVPRDDYERMLKLLKRSGGRAIEGLEARLPAEDRYPFPIVKFCDPNVRVEGTLYRPEFATPLWVDVFPMDRVSTNEKRHLRNMKTFRRMRRMSQPFTAQRDRLRTFSGDDKRKIRKWKLYKLAGAMVGGYKNALRLIVLHARWVNWRNRNSVRMGNVSWTIYNAEYVDLPNGFETQMHTFEGANFRVLCAYDRYLRNCYGDYMTPPRPEERRMHGMRAYVQEGESEGANR